MENIVGPTERRDVATPEFFMVFRLVLRTFWILLLCTRIDIFWMGSAHQPNAL